MSTIININLSPKKLLPSFNEADARSIKKKGWSFSYVYNFTEIRDIYLALREEKFSNLKQFTDYCTRINLPYHKTKWNKRRILEHLNALKNFELIDSDYKIIRSVFLTSKIGDQLDSSDFETFENIYFSYFRFKEIFSWFINPESTQRELYINSLTKEEITKQSYPIFSYSEKSRFTDSFFFDLNKPIIYFLDIKTSEDLMRFWDVFIKWGTVLSILEKFNLRTLGIKTISEKSIACTYVLNNHTPEFNLVEYLKENYSSTYVYIPRLVFELCLKLRLRVEKIQELIISQYKLHKEYLSFERTSEIFIKKNEIKAGDKILFLKYNDSYISHLIIRI